MIKECGWPGSLVLEAGSPPRKSPAIEDGGSRNLDNDEGNAHKKTDGRTPYL